MLITVATEVVASCRCTAVVNVAMHLVVVTPFEGMMSEQRKDKMWSADSMRSMMMKPRKSLTIVEPLCCAVTLDHAGDDVSGIVVLVAFLDVVLEDGCCSSCPS